jgi:hypothetical protein
MAVTVFHELADELEKLVKKLREAADDAALGVKSPPGAEPEPLEEAESEVHKAQGTVKKA